MNAQQQIACVACTSACGAIAHLTVQLAARASEVWRMHCMTNSLCSRRTVTGLPMPMAMVLL
eukprot:1828470-Amphidinium_carterae.1